MQATELLTSGPDPLKQQKKRKKRKKARLSTNIQEALEDKDLGNTSESAEVNLLDKQCDVTFSSDLKASEEEKADALCRVVGTRSLVEKHNLPSTSSQEALGEKDPSISILEDGEVDLNKSKKRKSNVISSNNNLVASKEEFLTTGMVCEVHDITLEDISTLTSQVNGNSVTALQTVETHEEITTTNKKRRGKNKNRCNALENSATKKPVEEDILCTQYQTNIESVEEDNEMKNNVPSESMDTDLIEIDVRSTEVKNTSSSLEGVQNGLMAEASTSNSSKTPLLNCAKRRNRRKKAKQILCEDKPPNDISEVGLLDDDNLVQEHVDETSKVQLIVEKCGASLDENIEESLTNSEEEGLPSSTTGCVTDDVTSLDPLDLSISLDRAPASNARRKLLILDLNGLLADVVSFQFNDHKPDFKVAGKSVFKRPFCDEFLKFCFEKFDVGVWSSRRENNVKTVVNFLMGDLQRKLLFCWGRSRVWFSPQRASQNCVWRWAPESNHLSFGVFTKT
ncbi:uncharacterized protein LOC131229404 isoform X2 [Magnolia sinica]|uniref:uncharacterized protein LOC131229404 isoform X2 n=1 Tax=Magnolia sinica TaxID=86752 RepID=UPI00265957D9|nr:uncharacterized protein LOC131229404 isoform X2 [Magnolia sinica]